MHPIRFFLDEIYQDYWGVPRTRQGHARNQEKAGIWLRSRPRRQVDSRRP
jgi:hypothetical protein